MRVSAYEKIWFTSDLHFKHKNILKFCPDTRPYRDTDEMGEALVESWNRDVGPNDLVFILGDVSFGDLNSTINYLTRLNGSKALVSGNHDRKLLKEELFRHQFVQVRDYMTITHDGHFVVMFHFPIMEWDCMHRGSFHLYGHVHGNKIGMTGRSMDVGWDAHGRLVPWEEVKDKLSKLEVNKHHGD